MRMAALNLSEGDPVCHISYSAVPLPTSHIHTSKYLRCPLWKTKESQKVCLQNEVNIEIAKINTNNPTFSLLYNQYCVINYSFAVHKPFPILKAKGHTDIYEIAPFHQKTSNCILHQKETELYVRVHPLTENIQVDTLADT